MESDLVTEAPAPVQELAQEGVKKTKVLHWDNPEDRKMIKKIRASQWTVRYPNGLKFAGLNAKCPCGSGKKSKKCCARPANLVENVQEGNQNEQPK